MPMTSTLCLLPDTRTWTRCAATRWLVTPLLLGAVLCALVPRLPAQDRAERMAEITARSALPTAEMVRATLVGTVLDPSMQPMSGAVVVSDAGGQAVTDSHGAFELVLEWPRAATALHLTAAASQAGRTCTSTLTLTPPAHGATAILDPIVVQEATACQPAWLPSFGEQPGVNQTVRAMAVFDDGQGGGPQLYVGGEFSYAGSQPAEGLARWNGSAWESVGDGSVGAVHALIVWDDGSGSGPALIVGGDNVARLVGSELQVLGGGVTHAFGGANVFALTVHDDGSGPVLCVGGFFDKAGSTPARNVASWNGVAWSAFGNGLVGSVLTLASFDPGTGAMLYAGGLLVASGTTPLKAVAQWDGNSWSSVGGGAIAAVYVLAVATLPLSSQPSLVAGGAFEIIGNKVVHHIAAWDGASWSEISGGVNGPVYAVALHDAADGSGPALYAVGDFKIPGQDILKIARFDGLSWKGLAPGFTENEEPLVLASYSEGGSGPALFVGGSFDAAGGVPALNVARFAGEAWSTLGSGFDGPVTALAVFDDGSGPALHAAGGFTTVADTPVTRIARWDGAQWHPLGEPMDWPVLALTVFDDGGGARLIAAGEFEHIGLEPFDHIAGWDGLTWSHLFPGPQGDAYCMAVWDDGRGPALYVGGAFTTITNPFAHIARWDGTDWSTLGTGTDAPVHSLAVYDDGLGEGECLIAGGPFHTAGGIAAHGVARWDGTSWSALGSGVTGSAGYVAALCVIDAGGDPRLVAGGAFGQSLGAPADYLAMWDGLSWSGIDGSPDGQVYSLAVQDDGSGAGPALYVAGAFLLAGGAPMHGLARWDGATWSGLGSGGGGAASFLGFDDGRGPALWIGGYFEGLVDSGDSFLSRWGCVPEFAAWRDLGSSLAGSSGPPVLVGQGTLEPGSAGSLELTQAKPVALAALFASTSSSPAPFKGGQLVPVPVELTLVLATDAVGGVSLGWTSWPAGLPPGASLYFQFAVQDPTAPKGVALSNALLATTP
jgi:trimeric autotransporter adhesin